MKNGKYCSLTHYKRSIYKTRFFFHCIAVKYLIKGQKRGWFLFFHSPMDKLFFNYSKINIIYNIMYAP